MQIENYITVTQAAEMLKVTRAAIQHHIERKNLPATRMGAKIWLIRKSDIERLQESRR